MKSKRSHALSCRSRHRWLAWVLIYPLLSGERKGNMPTAVATKEPAPVRSKKPAFAVATGRRNAEGFERAAEGKEDPLASVS